MAILTAIKSPESIRTFGIGVVLILSFYSLVFGYLFITKDTTLQSLESSLASTSTKVNMSAPDIETSHDMPHNEHVSNDEQSTKNIVPSIEDAIEHQEIPEIKTYPRGQKAKVATKKEALVSAPVAGVYENVDGQILPIRSKNGKTPFQVYKKPFLELGRPLIAVGILDYGLSKTTTGKILDTLPPNVTFIVSPYAQDVETLHKNARVSGHELWLSVPTQAQDYLNNDPGPKALLGFNSLKENLDTLLWTLSRTTGYAGTLLYWDSTLATSPNLVRNILREINKRGLGVVDANPDSPDYISKFAHENKIPYVLNTAYSSDASFKKVEQMAKDKGSSLVLVSPTPRSLKALDIWIKTLEQKNFALAPISALAGLHAPSDSNLSPATPIEETRSDQTHH